MHSRPSQYEVKSFRRGRTHKIGQVNKLEAYCRTPLFGNIYRRDHRLTAFRKD